MIGHPFAPVYLLPLVEIVGSEQTSQLLCTSGCVLPILGMRPLHVRREISLYRRPPAGIPLREALHLIDQATSAEIDAAVTGNPGLRWAFRNVSAWHLGGGPGGMRHTIEQFGPHWSCPGHI